ncbi:MAG: DMT family transporter [Bacteroidetes bacterium]|nr:DMT family transporter [Bacteroidota bacterium]
MPFIGELSALLTAFLWSGTSLVFTEATTRVGSIQVNITRMILALLFLVVTVWLLGADYRMSETQILNLALSGVIGLVIGDSFLFRAFKDIGARVSMLVMSMVPAMTAVMGLVFLGETLTPLGVTGMIITIAGIAVVVLERQPSTVSKYTVTPKGLMFALLGALGQATGLIFAKFALNESPLHGMVATTVRVAVAVALFLPAALLFKWYRNPFRVYARDKKALAYTTAGAVLGPYLGITFSLVAIAHTKVAIATTIMAMPPIIMLPLVWLAYRERLSIRAIIGAVIAVGGVALLFLR